MRGEASRRAAVLGAAIGLCAVVCATAAVAAEPDCQQEFPSTFALIQKAIFDNRGCNSVTCHDASLSGGLDLRPEAAYDSLVNQPSQTVPGWFRVFPGQRDRSLLFLNTAAATLPDEFVAPLRAMPIGGLPPLSSNELEAVRLWIENGAPRTGTVAGTGELLNACLPPPVPIKIDPLPPPPAELGVQIHMPRWIVGKRSEHEVCYASYYDITDQVPEEFRGPNNTVRFKETEIRQDPLSHHLIVNLYTGQTPITDSIWGGFKCRGGAKDGQACDPVANDCGADSGCANDPAISVACFGANNLPADASVGIASSGFTGTQKAADTITYAPGVFNQLPLKGIIIWNSHAFNTTDEDGTLEAWLNFYFAAPEEQQFPLQGIFLANPSILFKMDVPAFHAEEVCNNFSLPANAQLFELSSHMHHRGKRFRTFEGMWTCSGGPNAGAPCSPFGPDPAFQTSDLCGGGTCESRLPPKSGDCNADFTVTIDELVRGVNIALGQTAVTECPRFDMNDDGQVSITDLIAAVSSASQPVLRDPQESLLYTNFIYNDPVVLDFEPPRSMGGSASLPDERSVTYCALYDNGYSDPAKVKTQSGSPPTPLGIPGLFGGPCSAPTGCTAGKVGEPCTGTTSAQRNASCDVTGGDGVCDACPLLGGVTTEDEMFLLLGSYFINK